MNTEFRFTMSVENSIQYEVRRISNLYKLDNPILADYIKTRKAFCIIDSNLHHYVRQLEDYFIAHHIEAYYFYLTITEHEKNIKSIMDFSSFCFKHQISRRDTIIAFGGGIICDLGGLCANLLRRGTPCIKIPTTLLGIIDASVGVKNGINFAGSKNSIGTYCPPEAVLIDLSFLQSLSKKEIKSGLVEMIKIIALKDIDTWNLLKRNMSKFLNKDFDSQAIELIDRSIAFMLSELRSNLFEDNLNRIVDYGHEFGHLIEIITNHELSHGEAVGIGMLLSNHIAFKKGLMDQSDYEDFQLIYDKLQLPSWHNLLTSQKLYDQKDFISRHKGGNFNIVALQKIGSPIFINQLSLDDIEYAVNILATDVI
ncbi:3-dehydroquinate synthase family protein [Daejeonella oryzae]|uniref:3-dehydroquinate synthase family protein n=1 Tax=Daejeonella oryzae TaxID=1122943 RepID=UPI0004122C79|nr:iron-containing alcohol dehydrogenase [Daejeonella oryzae]